MAKGGKQPGAGRPKGSTTRVRVLDHFNAKEIKEFFKNLKIRAKTDTKIAIYLAEQMTGKAMQPVTGEDGGPIVIKFDNAFTSSPKTDSK